MITRPAHTAKHGTLRYHEISPLLSDRTAVFPGDMAFRREVAVDFTSGSPFLLSSLHMSAHLGAHTDGPNHYHPQGVGIDARDLSFYYGRCQVITVKVPRGERIRVRHLGDRKITAPRVLFKTGSFPNPDRWNGDFNSLSGELVEWLAERGTRLVGIDTPSIDPAEDKTLESHQAVFKNDLAILEGIVLNAVEDGEYLLIALPLRLEGADASPVRAILLPLEETGET